MLTTSLNENQQILHRREMAEDSGQMVLLVCGSGLRDGIANIGVFAGHKESLGMPMDRMQAETDGQNTKGYHHRWPVKLP